jgi:hypothetical protein
MAGFFTPTHLLREGDQSVCAAASLSMVLSTSDVTEEGAGSAQRAPS